MKKISYFFFGILLFLCFQVNVFAGSLSVWANVNTVTVGDKVTVSVSSKNVFCKYTIKVSDEAILSGPTSGNIDDGETSTYTFTAKSSGNVTITIVPIDGADYDNNGEYTQSKSVSVKVVNKNANNNSSSGSSNSSDAKKNNGGTTADKKEYDSDNTLKSLEIENYKISPEFNKDKTEYKLEVDESVEKVNVKATKNSDKAEIVGVGEKVLTPGENTIEIKVIAENGNEKIYKILVTVKDQNPITVKILQKKYTVVKKNHNVLEKPEYYDEEVIKIKDQDVVTYVNKNTKVRLIILKDENNKPGFYIYNEHSGKYSEYKAVTIGNITLQILTPLKDLKYFKKFEVNVKGEKVTIYKINEKDKVGLLYGTNIKTGNTDYFVYDMEEDSLNRYYDEEVKVVNHEMQRLKNDAVLFMGVAAGITIVTIMASIISTIKRKRKNNRL